MKEKSSNNVFAIGLILVGVILILRVFNFPFLENFNLGYLIGLLWPLFILIPGLNMLKRRVTFGGIFLTFLGGSFLLDNFLELYGIDFRAFSIFKFFWPAVFIYIGYRMLSGDKPRRRHHDEDFDYKDDGNPGKSKSITFNSKTYRYGLDDMPNGISKLNLNISFGGAEIIVEEGIQVILVGQYTLGGHEFFGKDAGGVHSEIKEIRYQEDGTFYDKTLIINAEITLGGIEVRRR